MMSNVKNLEQQIASLQIDNANNSKEISSPSGIAGTVKQVKKIGPAVPPKPKKSQPQVSYNFNSLIKFFL